MIARSSYPELSGKWTVLRAEPDKETASTLFVIFVLRQITDQAVMSGHWIYANNRIRQFPSTRRIRLVESERINLTSELAKTRRGYVQRVG